MGDLDGRLLSAQAVLENGRARHVVPACFPFSHTPGMTVLRDTSCNRSNAWTRRCQESISSLDLTRPSDTDSQKARRPDHTTSKKHLAELTSTYIDDLEG